MPDNLLTLDFADPAKAPRTVAEFARPAPGGRRGPRRRPHHGGRRRHRRAARPPRRARSPPSRRRATSTGCGRRSPGPASGRRASPCSTSPTTRRRPPARVDVSVRAQADDPRRQPGRDPRRRRAGRSSPRSGGSRRSSRSRDVAGLGRGRQEVLVEDFVPGREVALEGLLVGGRAPRPRPLRQARPARRAVLRGDDLRHALAAARRTSRRRSRPRRAGRRGPSGSPRGRSTPSCA